MVGFKDDILGQSLDFDPSFKVPFDGYSAMFFGLGSDGTVGANKNSIKIIGDSTDNEVQAYSYNFVYCMLYDVITILLERFRCR